MKSPVFTAFLAVLAIIVTIACTMYPDELQALGDRLQAAWWQTFMIFWLLALTVGMLYLWRAKKKPGT